MASHKKVKADRQRYYTSRMWEIIEANRPPCSNCGKPGSHFVPPGFGMEGFFACEQLNRIASKASGSDS